MDKIKYPALAAVLASEEDYRGAHGAPDKTSGSPMWNVIGAYPKDFYDSQSLALQYYGAHQDGDSECISIMFHCKGRENRPVRVYRAVPQVPSRDERIAAVEAQKRYIMKHGKIPPGAKTALTNSSAYFEKLCDDLAKLQAEPESPPAQKLSINPGDWVALTRSYAKEHGEATLLGEYKILSKTVKAKDLYTDGNSLQEWGYDPN